MSPPPQTSRWIGRPLRFGLAPQGQRLEQGLQALEREVVADEEPDAVARLEAQPVAEGAADRARLRHVQPRADRSRWGRRKIRCGGTWWNCSRCRLTMLLTATTRGLAPGIVLTALDRAVHPVLGIQLLGRR